MSVHATPYLWRTQSWGALVATAAVGVTMMAVIDSSADVFQSPTSLITALRVSFAVVAVGMSFLLAEPAPALLEAVPTPVWALRAVRLVLALPVVTAAGWAEISLASWALARDERLSDVQAHLSAWPGLAIELAGFGALAVLGASLVARSRWCDLGGAIAGPTAIALVVILAVVPFGLLPTAYLVNPTRSHHGAWLAAEWGWATIAVVALSLAAFSSRDQWRRSGLLLTAFRQRPVPAVPAGRGAGPGRHRRHKRAPDLPSHR